MPAVVVLTDSVFTSEVNFIILNHVSAVFVSITKVIKNYDICKQKYDLILFFYDKLLIILIFAEKWNHTWIFL